MTMTKSRNEAWGFFGTMGHVAGLDQAAAFAAAVELIVEASSLDANEARAFLDSRMGRHFADEVLNAMGPDYTNLRAAIAATVNTWMNRTVRRIKNHPGLDRAALGLPHLVAYAIAAEIAEELEA